MTGALTPIALTVLAMVVSSLCAGMSAIILRLCARAFAARPAGTAAFSAARGACNHSVVLMPTTLRPQGGHNVAIWVLMGC